MGNSSGYKLGVEMALEASWEVQSLAKGKSKRAPREVCNLASGSWLKVVLVMQVDYVYSGDILQCIWDRFGGCHS